MNFRQFVECVWINIKSVDHNTSSFINIDQHGWPNGNEMVELVFVMLISWCLQSLIFKGAQWSCLLQCKLTCSNIQMNISQNFRTSVYFSNLKSNHRIWSRSSLHKIFVAKISRSHMNVEWSFDTKKNNNWNVMRYRSIEVFTFFTFAWIIYFWATFNGLVIRFNSHIRKVKWNGLNPISYCWLSNNYRIFIMTILGTWRKSIHSIE